MQVGTAAKTASGIKAALSAKIAKPRRASADRWEAFLMREQARATGIAVSLPVVPKFEEVAGLAEFVARHKVSMVQITDTAEPGQAQPANRVTGLRATLSGVWNGAMQRVAQIEQAAVSNMHGLPALVEALPGLKAFDAVFGS